MRYFLILLLLTCISGLAVARSEVPFEGQVTVDGRKPVEIHGMIIDGEFFVDAQALAQMMKVGFSETPNGAMFNGKPVTSAQKISRGVYGHPVELAQLLNMKGEVRSYVLYLTSLDASGAAPAASLKLSIQSRNQITSPYPGERGYTYTVNIRNDGKTAVTVRGNQVVLLDVSRKQWNCNSNFEVIVPPGQSKQVENLVFNLPTRVTPYSLTLMGEDKAVLSSVRI